MVAFVDGRSDDFPAQMSGAVCVVGAGAAGLTVAQELARHHSDIILIESGGMEIDGQVQNLYSGRQLGLDYYNLASCRLRYFGGTTNHWGGYCRPNDPIDYEPRPEVGLPGWPITHDDLQPFASRAARILGIEAEDFSAENALAYRQADTGQIAENVSDILQTKAFLYASRLRMGPNSVQDIIASPNLRPVLNASLVHIELNEAANLVDHIICRTLDGKIVTVRARQFVICCHAIENARQLLLSDNIQRNGIGNDSGHVGKYFMEHPHIFASRFFPTSAFPAIYDKTYADRLGLNINLSFTDDYTRSAGLLQYYCRFNPVYIEDSTRRALEDVRANAMQPGDLEFLRDVATVSTELAGTVRYLLSRRNVGHITPDYYLLEHRLEQSPNALSRIVLSDRLDALGQPVADLDWRLSDHDIDSFARGHESMVRELSALGWGRVEEEAITRQLVEDRVEGHWHHIGTTRMSASPRDGVVDADCRVHGIDNLYVGGSSVFPSAGYSGPTMMIIALALRLSEHIGRKLA